MDMEQLLLCKLAEECSEVIKLCMKAQQFGLDNIDPETGTSNKDLLHGEMNDILGVIVLLNNDANFKFEVDSDKTLSKVGKVLLYANMSRELGKVKL